MSDRSSSKDLYNNHYICEKYRQSTVSDMSVFEDGEPSFRLPRRLLVAAAYHALITITLFGDECVKTRIVAGCLRTA